MKKIMTKRISYSPKEIDVKSNPVTETEDLIIEYPRLYNHSIYDLIDEIYHLSINDDRYYEYFKININMLYDYLMSELTFDDVMRQGERNKNKRR